MWCSMHWCPRALPSSGGSSGSSRQAVRAAAAGVYAGNMAAVMPAEALAVFQDLSAVDYGATQGRIRTALRSTNKVDELLLAKELAQQFRAQYQRTVELAESAQKSR